MALVLVFAVVALQALAQAPTEQAGQSAGNAGFWQNMFDYCRGFLGGQGFGMMNGWFHSSNGTTGFGYVLGGMMSGGFGCPGMTRW